MREALRSPYTALYEKIFSFFRLLAVTSKKRRNLMIKEKYKQLFLCRLFGSASVIDIRYVGTQKNTN